METPPENQPKPQSYPPERGRIWFIVVSVLALHAVVLGSVVLIQGCNKSEKPPLASEPSHTSNVDDQLAANTDFTSTQTTSMGRSPNNDVLIPEEHLPSGEPSSMVPSTTQVDIPNYTVETPKTVEPAPTEVLPKASSTTKYLVKKGDTLSKIAKKYSLTVQELTNANKVSAKTSLKVGQSLTIPPSQKVEVTKVEQSTKDVNAKLAKKSEEAQQNHVIKSGETLSSIAKRYGITVDSLVRANHIADPKKVRVNQKLVIPSSKIANEKPGLQQEQNLQPPIMEEPVRLGRQVAGI